MGQSNKENFIQIFRGEPADRILWIADLTYWRDSQIIKEFYPMNIEELMVFKLHKDLGVVPYYIYALDEQEPDGMSVHQIGAPGDLLMESFNILLKELTSKLSLWNYS